MRFYVILLILLLSACSDDASVSEQYSISLETELINMNKELKADLDDIYVHFDQSMAKQRVFNCFENFDSISNRSFRLKECSFEFRQKIEQLLVFPLDENKLNEIEIQTNTYRQNLIQLIDPPQFLAEGRIKQIEEKLSFQDFTALEPLNSNEFRIEKELLKSKFLRLEFLMASELLTELELDRSNFKSE
jgi:hypothetical protein